MGTTTNPTTTTAGNPSQHLRYFADRGNTIPGRATLVVHLKTEHGIPAAAVYHLGYDALLDLHREEHPEPTATEADALTGLRVWLGGDPECYHRDTIVPGHCDRCSAELGEVLA